MTDVNILYNRIYAKIREADNIFLVTHEKPDGDGLGSICAMMELLAGLDKDFFAFCADKAPANFSYLPFAEKIEADKSKFDFSDYDLVIVFDCGDIRRTKLIDEIRNRKKNQFVINIDHHPKIDDWADLEIKNPQAASTTELIFDFFKANKIRINKNVADSILTGISVDTGNFLFPATTDKTMQISSEMLERGAKLPRIMEKTWRNKSLAGLRAWGAAMARLEINKEYNLAFTVLTLADVEGVSDEELEGMSNFLSNLREVTGVLILFEKPGGLIKGSIRSAKADIAPLAIALGGGGHSKAAGFVVEGKLEKAGERWRVV